MNFSRNIVKLVFLLKTKILPVSRLRDKYLTLMQNCLTGVIYEDKPLPILGIENYDPITREYGWDWPSYAHSMIGTKRMRNLRYLSELIIFRKIPGDFIEAGVWRGGACIMMRAVLDAYNIKSRKVWVVDSFEGLPAPDTTTYPKDKDLNYHEYKELSVPLDVVKGNFAKYGLLDDQVIFLKGWFKDTLPTAPIKNLALLRIDGDLYESTIQVLDALYDKVSLGGYVIIDDYHVVEACKFAVHDFLNSRNIKPEIQEIDGVGIFFQKT